MENPLNSFLEKYGLFLAGKIGKGHSSQVFLVKNKKGKKFVLKMERSDSTRFKMAEREAENLKKANAVSIGPKLVAADLQKRIILMEFVQGQPFCEWLFSNPSKPSLKSFVKELQKQAKALDKIGLDHGQLAGRGKNILVRNNRPVIIDFEKSSSQRKCHNLNTVKAFLFKNPNGAIAAKVRKIVGENPQS